MPQVTVNLIHDLKMRSKVKESIPFVYGLRTGFLRAWLFTAVKALFILALISGVNIVGKLEENVSLLDQYIRNDYGVTEQPQYVTRQVPKGDGKIAIKNGSAIVPLVGGVIDPRGPVDFKGLVASAVTEQTTESVSGKVASDSTVVINNYATTNSNITESYIDEVVRFNIASAIAARFILPGTGDKTTGCLQIDYTGIVTTKGRDCRVRSSGGGGGGGSQTPWTSAIDADGFALQDALNLEFRTAVGSAPAGTVVALFQDNSGDLTANVLTAKQFNIAVNGTDEYNFSSTALDLNSNAITNATSYNGLVITANTGVITTGTWNGTDIAVSDGGTGVSTLTLNGVLYGNTTSAIQATAQGGANTVLVANSGAPSFSSAITVGTSVTSPTINATTALQLGGVDINTAGTLTNVAYENQANLFTLDQTITKADPSLVLNVTTATDTDFWLGVQDNANGVDDDVFHIGDGSTPGTNSLLSISTAGNVGIGVVSIDSGAKLEVNGVLAVSGAREIYGGQPSNVGPAVDFKIHAEDGFLSTGGSLYLYPGTGSFGDGNVILAHTGSAARGNVGIADTTPASLFTVGTGDLFQVNSSGAIASVVGITSSSNYVQTAGTFSLTSANTTQVTTASALALNVNSLTTGTGLYVASSSLSSGSLVNLSSTSTAAASNTQTILNIVTSGANATTTQNTYGAQISNTHTGTSSTNYGLQVTSSGGTNSTGIRVVTDNTTGTIYGIDVDARNLLTATTTLTGQRIQVGPQNFSSGATTVTGLNVAAGAFNNGGTVATAYGIDASLSAFNTAGITTGSIIRAYATDSGVATYGTLYGLNLSNWATLSATTTYGIYIDTSIDQGATRYALYSSATSNSYMAGNLGLGDVSPAALLTVGNGDLFQVNSSGAIASVVGITSSANYVQTAGTFSLTSANTTQVTTASALALNVNSLTTGTGLNIASSSLSSGALINLAITGTAGLTNQKGLNVSLSGANATGAQSTYGGYFSNTHTGTSTNIGLYSTATGGTNNYAAIFEAGNVGIGTTTPTYKLDIMGAGASSSANLRLRNEAQSAQFVFEVASSTQAFHAPQFASTRARGTLATPTVVADGDTLFLIDAAAYDSNSYETSGRISFEVDGTPGDNDVPGRIIFSTTADGAVSPTERLRINNAGNVGIGDTSPLSLLTVGAGDLFQVNTSGAIAAVVGITNTGSLSTALGATASTNAVCSSLANATAPTAGVAYELRDCNAAPAADYAESYPVETGTEYGDLMAIGTEMVPTYDTTNGNIDWTKLKGNIPKLVKTSTAYQTTVIGVVSDNYGDFTSAGHNIRTQDNPMPIALVGRVPVKVTTENGNIIPGDFITSSSTPGVGMKATKAGPIIGQALEGYSNSGIGKVMVFVKPPTYNGTPLENDIAQLQQQVSSLQGSGQVNFSADAPIVLSSQLYLSGDSVGEAKILEGNTEVRISFARAYQYQPIVTVTPQGKVGSEYWISNKDSTGFTINVDEETSNDITFDWHSFAGPEAKLTVSNGSSENIQLVVPQVAGQENSSEPDENPTPPVEALPEEVEPETPVPEPLVEPTPELTPEPASEPDSQP